MIKAMPNLEARIYIGSCYGYSKDQFTEDQLKNEISKFQGSSEPNERTAVRLTKTGFLFCHYWESGWEIGILNYPRFPLSFNGFSAFANGLADHLLQKFDQNRISVVIADTVYLHEKENPDESPVHMLQGTCPTTSKLAA